MKRRNEARAAEEAAVAEVEERDRATRAEAEGKDAARAALGPKLAEWALETSGRKKDIRALLATMQVCCYEGFMSLLLLLSHVSCLSLIYRVCFGKGPNGKGPPWRSCSFQTESSSTI